MATETEVKPTENGSKTNGVTQNDLESKITEQIEYYFGDINLARDKFLQDEIKKDEGWVELTTLLKFQRLAKMTKEPNVIVDALKKSKNELIVVSEDNLKIRRNPDKALPTFDSDFVKDLMAQSLYVKYIPLTASLDDIKEFFKKNASEAQVKNIIMRNYLDKLSNEKKFKGSIFVTFDSKENAEKFLNENKDKELKFDETCENALIIQWQSDYHEAKKQETRSKKNKPSNDNDNKPEETKPNKKEIIIYELPLGALVKVSNIKEPVQREDLREYLVSVDADEVIDFIEFNEGNDIAYVRYKNENGGEKVMNKIENKEVDVKDVKVTFELLSGEDEKTVLERMKMDIFKRRQKLMNDKKGGKRFGGRRGHKRSHGGSHGFNKRRRDD